MDDPAKHKVAADLCRLISRLQPQAKVPKANQRLAKLSEEVTKIAIKESRRFCNCELITVVDSWHCKDFAAKLEVTCPIHGPCRLGIIVSVTGLPDERDPRDRELAGLLRAYDLKCAAWQRKETTCEVKTRSAKH